MGPLSAMGLGRSTKRITNFIEFNAHCQTERK